MLTFAELDDWANRIAHSLVAVIKVGEPVGVCVPRSFEMIAAMLGVLKAGACYLPIGLDWPAQYFADIRTDAGFQVVLKAGGEADQILVDKDIQYMDIASFRTGDKSICPPLDVMVDPADLAYIIFTSGTTGRPKGVMVSHQAICNRLLWMREEYEVGSGDRILQKTPYTFDVSVWELFLPLLSGARLVMARPDGHRMADYISQVIRSQGITIIHFVPSMLRVFLQLADLTGLSSLRLLICSGEALPYDIKERCLQKITCRLDNLYGPTEAAVDVSFWPCRSDSSSRIVPIGKPISNITFQVVDESLQPVPMGNKGELCISGIGLARGYVNQPGLTAAAFVPNPALGAGERMYRTGDQVRLLADGNLEYLGRGDRQVKIRGVRIELDAIEAILVKHDSVRASAVLLRETAAGNRLIVAYVVLKDSMEHPESADMLHEYIGQHLPDAATLSAFMFLDELPVTVHGKIDQRALPLPFQAGTGHDDAPCTQLEWELAELFQQILKVPSIGRHDDFWELGGESLKAAELSYLIGQDLPGTLIYQRRSVASLADYLVKHNVMRVSGSNYSRTPVRQSFRQVFTRHLDALLAIESDKHLRERKQKVGRWFRWLFPGKPRGIDHVYRFPYVASFALALEDDPRPLNCFQRAATLVLSARQLLIENGGGWAANNASLWGYAVFPRPHAHWWTLANKLTGPLPVVVPFGLRVTPGSKTNEIVVFSRGGAYALNIQADMGVNTLANALGMIASVAGNDSRPIALGSLMGVERLMEWSRWQKKLKASQTNRATLDRIRSSALVLCLVDEIEDREEALLNELAADSPYRWHEKALQIIVTPDSRAGIVFNHLAIDGVPAEEFTSTLQRLGARTELAGNTEEAVWESLPWDFPANDTSYLPSSNQIPGFVRKWFSMPGAGKQFWQANRINESSAVVILTAIAAYRRLGYLPLIYDTLDVRHVNDARVIMYHPINRELAEVIARLAQCRAVDSWAELFVAATSVCDTRRQIALEGGDGINWCLPVGMFTARTISDRISRRGNGHPCIDLVTGVLSPVAGVSSWHSELGNFNACYFIVEPDQCAVSLQGQIDFSGELQEVAAEAMRYLAPWMSRFSFKPAAIQVPVQRPPAVPVSTGWNGWP